MPPFSEKLPWDTIFSIAVTKLNIRPLEFWGLTFGEFWPLFNLVMGKVEKPMSRKELDELNNAWIGKK